MIAKLTTGNGFSGAAKYDLRVGKKAEPTDPKEVKILGLKGNINYIINERQEISVDIRQLARDFRFQAMMRPAVRKPVYHWVLSWKKGEHISDTDMLERANEFMNAIGFENTQYIIIRHKKDNEHCHVLANIVDSCGNRISTEDLINRAHFAARMITKINGYAWGDNPTKETIENIHNPHEKIRYEIEPIVKEAVAKATCIEDVPDILKSHNISCEIKYSGEGKPVGISFAIEKDGQVHSFRGSSLDRKLSCKGIIRTIANNNLSHDKEFYQNMKAGYLSIIPPMAKDIRSVMNNTFRLYEEVKDARIAISAGTGEKYNELRASWMRFNELNEQRRKAKSYYHASKAMGEMLMLLNPIIGLAVILLAKVTAEIRQSNIQAQRNHLLRQIEQIRGEITKLEAQKAQLKIENQELLHAYLDAKTAYKEYKEGLKVVDQEIHGAGIEEYAKTAEIVSGVIHITPSNYRSIILPQGFSIHSHGNTPILCTPYSNHVIPVGGLYLANETVMTENTYRSYQQRHKTARSTNKPTKEGVKL